MEERYLFLFHSTLGVVKMKKRLQSAGVNFRVADVPRALRAGCGLSVYVVCPPGEQIRWYAAGETESVYRCQNGEYHLIITFPAGK